MIDENLGIIDNLLFKAATQNIVPSIKKEEKEIPLGRKQEKKDLRLPKIESKIIVLKNYF